MVSTNGKDPILSALDELDRLQQEKIERLENEIVAKRVQIELAQRLKEIEEQPKRGAMTAKEISDYLRTHGREAYEALEWAPPEKRLRR